MIFSDSCNPKSIMRLFIKLLEATFKNQILNSIKTTQKQCSCWLTGRQTASKQHLHDLRYRYRCATVIQFKLVKCTGHQKLILRVFFLAKLFTYSAMSSVEA